MANDNNIKNFTALDIEKYHKGQLSAKEMHDLEKASLDDPFLADALEGYAVSGINVNADIAELKKRLEDKTEEAKVIPMYAGGRSSFPWLRAAVMIVLIAGVGLIAYQFLFKTGSVNKEIAQAPKETQKVKDSAKILTQANSNDSSPEYKTTNKIANFNTESANDIKDQKSVAADKKSGNKFFRDSITINSGIAANNEKATAVPARKAEENRDFLKQRDDAAGETDIVVKKETKSKDLTLNTPVLNNANGYLAPQKQAKEVTVIGYGTKRTEDAYRNTNLFRGRVTDASNNALPFANITNTVDNVGTYSDAQGNFTLVSPDSVLNVQVRSVGFQSNNVQLRGYIPDNQVMLQEDRSLNATILDTAKRNISRARNNTMTFEEPEPEDGWGAYGAYVVNNLNIPETFDIKKGSETAENTVEVSFEVNKNGDPVNIKVEKSLCDKCDKEAIRLIKEGPKWKRKVKKTKRTTVTVPFIKTD